MELGVDGVTNSESHAANPLQMAVAMKFGIEAGRLAYQAGRIPKALRHGQQSEMDTNALKASLTDGSSAALAPISRSGGLHEVPVLSNRTNSAPRQAGAQLNAPAASTRT